MELWGYDNLHFHIYGLMEGEKKANIPGHEFYFDWDIQYATKQNINLLACPLRKISGIFILLPDCFPLGNTKK